jgi:uncharacterized protein YerC
LPHEIEEALLTDENVTALREAILSIEGDGLLLMRFLRDLLTYDEIIKVSRRLAVAYSLISGNTQTRTAKTLGLSTKTVNAVAQWVQGPYGTGAYREVYSRVRQTKENTTRAP